MYYVANTDQLLQDGILTEAQADEIKQRARGAMVTIAVNMLLTGGIVAATLGLIFLLRDAFSVAVFGGLLLAAGLLVLRASGALYQMAGNASALIGAGMLIGGSGLKIAETLQDDAGPWLLLAGALIAALCVWRFLRAKPQLRFAYGAAFAMAMAMHLTGVYMTLAASEWSGLPVALTHFYVTAALVAAGFLLDSRLITAIAIVPFAQMLDTGTYYFTAAYVFYSPEPTLTVLQMALLIAGCLYVSKGAGQVVQRQAGVLMVMAFVVANLSALVGSIWGDVVGSHLWGPQGNYDAYEGDWNAYDDAVETFRDNALVIGEGVFSVLWALALAALVFWAAQTNRRALFNAAMTFAGIHLYTQMFESFYASPLAYVIGGFMAIPLAMLLWRLNNEWFGQRPPAGV